MFIGGRGARVLPLTCQRVCDPLDSLFAIELSATAYNVRVLIEGTAYRTVYAHDWSFLHGFVTQS